MTPAQLAVRVDMIADLACPWCCLGLVRLERAFAARPNQTAQLRWRPFFLNPQLPPDGMDRREYLALKFGGERTADQIYSRITESAAADGLTFAFDRVKRTPNTLLAHRLILLAQQRNLGAAMIHALFAALFQDGENVMDPVTLTRLAAEIGLAAAEVKAFLAADTYADEVIASHRNAGRLGVRGVPVYVFGGEQMIAGAQPPEVLAGLIDVAAGGTTAPSPASAA